VGYNASASADQNTNEPSSEYVYNLLGDCLGVELDKDLG